MTYRAARIDRAAQFRRAERALVEADRSICVVDDQVWRGGVVALRHTLLHGGHPSNLLVNSPDVAMKYTSVTSGHVQAELL
ncbi:MAG: hypothetical protein DIU68_005755 [Chloroflexota bacterium]